MVRLFDVENGKVIPTEHCYVIKYLKAIMDNYPKDYMSIYAYFFYMTCPNPDLNPYFDIPEDDKEELILHDVEATFLPDDPLIKTGLEGCLKMYDTATFRAFRGIKAMLDKLAKYMDTEEITNGRDGNGTFILNAAKNYASIRASYKDAYKDLMEEQQSRVRGGAGMAYDG